MNTTEFISKSGSSVWQYRIAAVYFVLFMINSLGTTVIASFVGVTWSQLDSQGKFMIVVAIVVNSTNTMLAFLSKHAKKVDDNPQPQPVKLNETNTSSVSLIGK